MKVETNAEQLADKTLQRPRKTGARFTNSNIAPDEHLQPNLSMDFDGKRDRWNGYDLDQHKHIVEEFQKIEEVRAGKMPITAAAADNKKLSRFWYSSQLEGEVIVDYISVLLLAVNALPYSLFRMW